MTSDPFPDAINGPAGQSRHQAIKKKTKDHRGITILMRKLQGQSDEPGICGCDPCRRAVHPPKRTRKAVPDSQGPTDIPCFVAGGKKQELVGVPVTMDQPK